MPDILKGDHVAHTDNYIHIIKIEQFKGADTVEKETVKSNIQKFYGLYPDEIEKVKNVCKIRCKDKFFCLKVIKYEYGHFIFIISAIKHLQSKGFETIPAFIKTLSGNDYIEIDGKYAYLTEWIDARESDYDNTHDIILTAQKMAELHIKSRNFSITPQMFPRTGWFKWIETYSTRINEILDFKNRIENKKKRTRFDNVYLGIMEEEIERGKNSIDNLSDSDYMFIMEQEITEKGFCHHDFACHNVLIKDNDKVNIIDFDYCILDSHLHDLSSFLMRTMKNGRWSIENALIILRTYNEVYPLFKEEIPVMAAFLEFPQDYWQIGIQYYWERQPWSEDFFMKRLDKIIEDRDMRQEFIDDFRHTQYAFRNIS